MKISILIALTAVLTAIPLYGSQNLLKNADFENGMKGWTSAKWGNMPSEAEFYIDTNQPHSGGGCAAIKWISGGNNLVLAQTLPLQGKKNLVLTFWAKSDVMVGLSDRVQTTLRTFGKDGKPNAEPQSKIYTTSDIYQEFSWSMETPDDTERVSILLRCVTGVTAYFDDVTLIESQGIALKSTTLWTPDKTIVLGLRNELAAVSGNAAITAELLDAQGQVQTTGNFELAPSKEGMFSLTVGDIAPGKYMVRVFPAAERNKAVTVPVMWPELIRSWNAPYEQLKVRNNFVTELLIGENLLLASHSSLKFLNPREGWVYFSFIADKACIVQLPGKAQVQLALKSGETVESMQYLPAGENAISAHDAVKFSTLVITTMPEIMMAEYETNPSRKFFVGDLMQTPEIAAYLHNSNVILERFAGSDELAEDFIPDGARERIIAWRATGRKTVTNVYRPRTDRNTVVKVEETEQFWPTRVGLRELDGISIDEFSAETDEMVPYYNAAVKKINRLYTGKTVYAYCNPAWYAHKRTIGFRETLAAGGHVYAPELYLRTQKNEAEARKYVDFMFDYLRQWEKAYPGSMRRIMWIYGSSDSYYASYIIDNFASANDKYFLDLQFNLVANDPAFFGIRGFSPWILRYTKPDMIAWQAKLIRHYAIEGRRDLLSVHYGFTYEHDHLVNPDLNEGLKGWTVEPAGVKTIFMKNIPGYGLGRGTRNVTPDGDDVAVMTRVPNKVNSISQKIINLKPGHIYELMVRSADYDAVMNGETTLKVMPLSVKLTNAEIDYKRSILHVYPTAQTMPPKFKDGKRFCGNNLAIIFKATASESMLTISDEIPDVRIKVWQYHDLDYAPVDPAQKSVMFNYIQVAEQLPRG